MTVGCPNIVILAGPNGAGKTTAAPFLLRDHLGVTEFVNADDIARGLSGFAPERAAVAAGRIMLGRMRQLAAERLTFAFETTLSTRSYAPWLSRLSRDGYRTTLLFLALPSADLAVARVRQRVVEGGHSVPGNIVRRRFARGLRNFFDLYTPLVSDWAIYDNSGASPMLLARGRKGEAPVVVAIDQLAALRAEAGNG